MPMLRGTPATISYSSASHRGKAKYNLQAQIDRLRRQLNEQKPGLCSFREGKVIDTSDVPGTEFSNYDYDLTDAFVKSPQYPLEVTGDQFRNHSLQIKGIWKANVVAARVLVYVPKDASTVWANPATELGFHRIPDPAAWTVLMDRFIPFDTVSITATEKNAQPYSFWISLKKMKTIHNRSSNKIEKNNIHIHFCFQRIDPTLPIGSFHVLHRISDI